MKWLPSLANTPPVILNDFLSRSWLFLFARVTQAGAIFFIFLLYSIRLTKDLYGTYQKIFLIISLCPTLLGLGMPLLISSLPKEQSGELILSIWKKTQWIYLGCFGAVAIFIYYALPSLPLQVRLLSLALSVIATIYIILEILLIKKGKDKIIFAANLVYTVLFAAVHIWILFRPFFSLTMLLISLIILSLCRIFFTTYLYRRSGNGDRTKEEPVPEEMRMQYTRQWIFLSLNETIEAFSANIDNFFLLWLLSAAGFAIYVNGSYEIPLTGLLISVAGTFIKVQIKQYHLKNDTIVHLFSTVCLILSFILFPLFFFVLVHAGSIFNLLFQGKYNDSIDIFIVAAWIIPFRIANYTVILQDKLKSNIILQGSILGLTGKIILCALLYEYYGVQGIAAAMVIATVIQICFYLYHSAIQLNIKVIRLIPFRELLPFFIVCGIISWLGKSLTLTFAPSRQLLTGIIILMLSSGTPFYFFYRKLYHAKT